MAEKAMNEAKDILAKMDETKSVSDELRKDFNEMAAKFSKAKFANDKPELKSWEEQFAEAYTERKSEVDQTITRQKAPLVFDLKSVSDIGLFNTIEAVGSESHYSLTQNTGIISAIRKRVATYLQRVSTGALAMTKPYGMWIEELDEQGAPIFIGEGDTKTQISVRYEEREKKAKKIAV
jgi:hypothetical protein